MKVLLIASLLSFLFVANARISDEVLSCRWHVFRGDFKVLYIYIDEPTVPRKETIDRFCSQVRKYEECVANVESEQLTVELMQGMCEYGFDVVYDNITCLQKAVNKIRSTCLPRQGDCASSVEWFRCSEMVTRDLCGEALAFIMEVLQPLYCEITEALQSDQPIPYDLVPFHGKKDSLDTDDDISEEVTEKKKEVITIEVSKEGQNTKTKTETDSSTKVTVKPSSNSKINTKHEINIKPSHRTTKDSAPKTSMKPRTSMKTTHRTTKGSTPKTSMKPRTSMKTTHRTTKGSTPKSSMKPRTSMKTTHRTTKGSTPKTSMKPRTSMKPTHGTTKGPKPHSSMKPRTSMKPTHITTKGPKPPITTHSGNSKLTSSGNFVLSVVVGTLLMKNF